MTTCRKCKRPITQKETGFYQDRSGSIKCGLGHPSLHRFEDFNFHEPAPSLIDQFLMSPHLLIVLLCIIAGTVLCVFDI
jgi:hypothetical protein